MINLLRKFDVELQAIEQPLDLTIPENKMMPAFYLAVPEVKNDRRALNTFHGMRRARKEGRYIPKYKNEENRFVEVQHETIISEGLFYRVQDFRWKSKGIST